MQTRNDLEFRSCIFTLKLMDPSVPHSRDLFHILSLETLSHVSAHSSTSLALAIDSINIVARYFNLQLRYSMIQSCFRDCKHIEVVGDDSVLYS